MAKGQTDIRAFIRDVKKLENGKVLVRMMTKEFRKEARPALQSVRKAALALPSKGQNARRGRPSLRGALARATVLKTQSARSATLVIKTDPKRMPDGLGGLPPYVEGTQNRWRSPVFGNRDVWVGHDAMPFFYATLRPYEPKIRDAGDRVISEIKRELEK